MIMPVTFLAGIFSVSSAQKADSGEILKVYSNFHYGLIEDDHPTAFEVTRVYLGYKHDLSDHFSAEAKLDIGSPEDLSQYSLIRRYAYFKTAALTYKDKNLTAWFGLFDMREFKVQENFWGYRYIYKSYQDAYKFGPSADIGTGVHYRFNDFIEADLVVSNGEGYKNLQTDNSYKTGAGVTLHPLTDMTFRLYYDFNHKDITQYTYAFFAGYDAAKYRIGAEYNLQQNFAFVNKHNLYGYSFYGTYTITDKWEIFGRYDWLHSSLTSAENIPWHLNNDGSAIISGVQYTPVNQVRFSLNYQDWYSYAKNGTDESYIYVNLEFKL